VFICKLGSHEDGCLSVCARSVGEELAKVFMVCGTQQIINDHRSSGGHVFADDIDAKSADRRFGFDNLQVHANHGGQQIYGLSQPWREVTRLIGPN
jgi:hypothetical protein